MPQEVPIKTLVEYSFQSGAYSPTGNSDLSSGSPTVVGLTLSSIPVDEAKQSSILDLGLLRPPLFSLIGALEYFAAITSDGSVDFYWSGSNNIAAAGGNPGNPSGVDGAYTGDGSGDLAASLIQLDLIGAFSTTSLVGVQIADIGSFVPVYRYGQLIVFNNSSTTICGTDDIESSILMSGTIQDVQDP